MKLQPYLIHKKEFYNFDGAYLVDKKLEIKRDYDFVHYHNVFEIGIVIKGNGTFLINNQIKYFSEGDISVMYPGDFHITNSVGSSNSVWDYILIDANKLISENPAFFEMLGDVLEPKNQCSNVFSSDKYPLVHQYVHQLHSELTAQKDYFDFSAKNLFSLLLIEIYRNSTNDTQNAHDISTDKGIIHAIIPAITYISKHYKENITSSTLSNACSISQTHLRRLFKNYFGISPFKYIYKVRITAAKSLLCSTNISITDIAQEVGYLSQTSFNNHFKHFTGITPSEYRKKQSGK